VNLDIPPWSSEFTMRAHRQSERKPFCDYIMDGRKEEIKYIVSPDRTGYF
jgi:hypothetical protein